jgi:FeS assembly protein IscX
MGASPEGGGVALTWKQPDEVAWALIDAHPDIDPLELNFVDLHLMVVELDGFTDGPDEASETLLEAIVMAWHEQR